MTIEANKASRLADAGEGLHPFSDQLLFSYADARRILGGISESTFERWVRQGLLKPIQLGGRRKFLRRQDLLAFAQLGQVG